MSEDWVVRTPERPQMADLLAALAGASDSRSTIGSDAEDRFLVLTRGNDRVWVTPVRAPYSETEATRLLRRPTALGRATPYWVEVHGPTRSSALVAKVAESLAVDLSGTADRCGPADG